MITQSSKLNVSELRALKSIKGNEVARAVASKLIRDTKQTGTAGYDGKYIPKDDVINKLSKQTATNIEDASSIFQTLPDLKIAMEIWVSCILTPKDGVTESLIWNIDNQENEYSAKLFGEMLDVLRDFFENEYDIFQHLRPAVEDALFKTGSYPLVIVPESSVDDIINGKSAISSEAIVETLYKKVDGQYHIPSIGILGEPTKIKGKPNVNRYVGIESIISNATVNAGKVHQEIHNGVSITDNVDILKIRPALSQLQRKRKQQSIRSHYGIEAYASVDLSKDDKVTSKDRFTSNPKEKESEDVKSRRFDSKVRDSVVQALYKERAYTPQKIVKLNSGTNATRLPIGHPLALKIPSSSVIPVHTPGNPWDYVGAFIILDEFGNPLDSSRTSDLFSEQRKNTQERVGMAKSIIQQMNFYTEGCCNANSENQDENLNELARAYGSLFEEDLISRLANGLNGENVEISKADEVYRIMFARALAAMRTQILYVPAELITYFAFDFNKYGIGKSLLEDGRTLAAMRATLQYAEIYASIMNSIGRKKLIATLDEDTVDVNKTLEVIRSEYTRANAWNLPLISEGPVDVINTLRENAIDFVLEGDNPALPTTRVDVEDVQLSRPVPDETIRDRLKNMQMLSMGLPATAVDDTQQTEFATVAVQSNALLNKRVINYQGIVSNNFLHDHVTKFTLNSGRLIKELSLVIKENKDLLTDEQRAEGSTLPIIEDFLDRLEISLPAPENMRLEDQKKDFDAFKDIVDTMIDASLPDDLITKALPESIRDDATAYREIIKSILINQHIDQNNYLPGLRRLVDMDNPDDTVEGEIETYFKPIVKAMTSVVVTLDKVSKLANSKELENASADEENDSFGGGDSFGGDDDSMDDTGDGDDFGDGGDGMGDDFGMGDDGTGDEEGGDIPPADEDVGF